MNTLEILTGARAAIAEERHWRQGIRKDWASDGRWAFCALGAIDEALNGKDADYHPATAVLFECLTSAERERAYGVLHRRWGHMPDMLSQRKHWVVVQFNNSSTHAEVLAAFDRAIERQRMIDGLGVAAVERELVLT